VADVQPGDFPIFVEAFGTVTSARETRIQPEVGGRIVALHPELVRGGVVGKGELLFKIDPADYEIALAQAEAQRNVAELQVERLTAGVEALRKDAEQSEAELTYLKWNTDRLIRLSERGDAGEAEARDAQSRSDAQQAALGAIRARVLEQEKATASARAERAAADSRVAAAKLALARTEVVTPFDAIVRDESIELGQLVSAQATVATLVATDQFWVDAAVPITHLPDIHFARAANGSQPPTPEANVTVTLTGGDGPRHRIVREGYTLRTLSELDPQGRMARVLIAVDDPLDLRSNGHSGARRLLLGSYVRLKIAAGELEGVYAIPRRALRENQRVWVRDAAGTLRIRDVEILWRRTEDVLVRDGFQAGDQVVTTNLTSIVPGMELAVRTTESSSDRNGDKPMTSQP
jgi:RND family efflux transporter MFP subunit